MFIFASYRCIRYRKAMAKRRARRVAWLDRQQKALKAQLYDLYINAPTYTEARRIMSEIWMLSL